MCYSMAEAMGNTVQDDIDQVIVSHLGIDIKFIDIVEVFLDSPCLFEITELIKRPVLLLIITREFSHGILDLLPGSIPVPISFPPI